ncbi:hypothetical protein LJC27_06435 [Christensenellaceae bacterium OttesenSCG-928-M15]|nr:hypothetical protein [Christensenellaceae bacterium OttesenSCG-928-M15]
MFTDKSKVLADAPTALNKPEQPWEVKIEGDSIIANWKWQDAAFAATRATKDFTFTLTLNDKGKWKERELLGETSRQGRSMTLGKTSQKSIEFSIGKKKDGEKVGINEISSMDTGTIKRAIRDYLTSCGWKKAGLFDKF